jgi:MarR family transcriptional regulator, organic hydroperoxide resistance regulator
VASKSILAEIQQNKPFPSLEEEAWVALLKTADTMRRHSAGLLEPHEITEQQYNVLRILRGAGDCGLPTLAIAERLIEHTPGITRLIDRLEAKAFVRRERPERDRRQVYCFITKSGLNLLKQLDPLVNQSAKEAFASVSKKNLDLLLETLAKIRNAA